MPGVRAAAWIALLLWGIGCPAWAQPDPFPDAAIAYLVKAGDAVLWQRAAAKRLPPASLTKLMAALLVGERYEPLAVVTISRAAAAETGTRLGVRAGERLRAADLLAATLIASANDACHALADHVAGSEARFVVLMNRRARAWGLRDTQFVNACGHDAPGHYSSARDIAALAQRAVALPVVAQLVAIAAADIASADGVRQFHLTNSNALIGRYPGAVGIKSGYTPGAGKCLVALAERGGRRVLLVLLNAADRWWGATDMLDLAFERYPS
jgi:D-alanyl-D-alanine carboxypeptidase (penicillin-binding protein 5/6)